MDHEVVHYYGNMGFVPGRALKIVLGYSKFLIFSRISCKFFAFTRVNHSMEELRTFSNAWIFSLFIEFSSNIQFEVVVLHNIRYTDIASIGYGLNLLYESEFKPTKSTVMVRFNLGLKAQSLCQWEVSSVGCVDHWESLWLTLFAKGALKISKGQTPYCIVCRHGLWMLRV